MVESRGAPGSPTVPVHALEQMLVHVPMDPATLQASHVLPHAALQQTPSTHNPDEQSVLAVHEVPFVDIPGEIWQAPEPSQA